MSEFYRYFKQNMEAMGLAAPESLFGTLQAAVASATTLIGQVEKFGPKVTVHELIGAGSKLEFLGTAAACSAAYYVGAVIGSIAVATGRSVAGGVTIADVMFTADQHNLNRPWLFQALINGR
jgi:hypothetical protein